MSQKFKSDIETQAGLIDSFGFSGSAGQILSSTGTKTEWITPPQSPGGGGSSQVFYFNGGVASSVGGYYQMSPVANTSTGADFTINANGYIASFLTDVNSPNQLNIPAGNWNFEIYFNASSGGGSPSFYVELYKYSSSTFTLIASSSATPEGITNGTAIDLYITALAVPTTTLLATDRLAVRVYVTHSGRTIKMHTQNGHLSEVITTFSTGLTALNGLTEQVQYFATGAGGTDFNIASAVNTHTFNLPTASATNRGALSSADWITFNSKANASGTTNYLSKFTGTTTLGNSLLFDNGTNVGIGTTSPSQKLEVSGTGYASSDFRAPIFYDSNDTNYYVDPANSSTSAVFNGKIIGKHIFRKEVASGSNAVKTYEGVLATRSDNGDAHTYYVIETNVAQDSFQMGGFYIDLFNSYSATNQKTTIGVAGYWNPESNGGFIGFEATSTNPNVTPNIQVVRKNSTGNTCFIITLVGDNYPIIVARDLYLGYIANDTSSPDYGDNWVIVGTNDISGYSNNDTIVWNTSPTRTGDNASGTWGINITGTAGSETLATVTGRGATSNNNITITNTAPSLTFTATGLNRSATIGITDGANMYISSASNGNLYLGSGTTTFVNGTLSSNTDLRAPIFYDSDNTGYYLNPNGSSYVLGNFKVQQSSISGIELTSPTGVQSLWIRAGYDTNGAPTPVSAPTNITFQSSGNSGGTFTFVTGNDRALLISGQDTIASGSFRAPIFYDSDDTAYYLNANSTSNLASTYIAGHYYGSYNTNNILLKCSSSASYMGVLGQSSSGAFGFQLFGDGSNYGFLNGNWADWDIRKSINGNLYLNNQNLYYYATDTAYLLRVYGTVDMRSPIYYDLDNTAYYLDPNSTAYSSYNAGGARFRNIEISNSTYTDTIQNVTSGGNIWINYGHNGPIGLGYGGGLTTAHTSLAVNGTLTTTRLSNTFTVSPHAAGVDIHSTGNFAPHYQTDFSWYTGAIGGGTNRATLNSAGDFTANSSVRSPIFYDSNNTAFYLDPSGSSVLNGTVVIKGNDNQLVIDGTTGALAAGLFFSESGVNKYELYHYSGEFRFYNYTTNQQEMSINNANGFVTARTSFRAPIFYDSNNTAYYTDPASTSVFNGLTVAGYELVRSRTQGNWAGSGVIDNVVGLLTWKNYGSNHVIFDASNGTTPSGTSCSSSDPQNNWTGTYPTLMGWNGNNTYGVRVDSARVADSVGSVAWASITGKPNNIFYYQGFTLDANTMDANASGFTYAVNAPFTGPIARFATNGNYDMWINSPYSEGGYGFAFRTRNGDTATLNPWRYPAVYDVNANGGGVLYATVYYDQNDTGYYTNPNGSSVLNTVTGNNFYNYGWFRNYNNNTGLYNQANGNHIYSRGGTRWGITGNGSSSNIYLDFYGDHESTYRGSVHADTNSTIGFLTNDQGWGLRVETNKNVYVHGNTLYINADAQASSNIIMKDGDEGDRTIHCNSNKIGFLTQGGSWGSYCSDNGDWSTDFISYAGASSRAPIFYDSDDTGYYLNPAWVSNLNLVIGQSIQVQSTTPVLVIQDVDSTGAAQVGYISYANLSGTETGWVGFGSNGNTDFTVKNTLGRVLLSGTYAEAEGSMRAPIFYDSDNTGYFVNPASSTTSINVAGNIDLIARSAGWSEGIRVRVPSTSTWGGIRFTRDRFNDDGNWAIGFTGIDASDDLTFWKNNAGSEAMAMRLTKDSVLTVNGDVRSPIFYDSNNTGFYVNPAGASNVNRVFYNNYLVSQNSGGLMGDYNINGTAAKCIWTIGESWPLSNMYGLGYEYDNTYYHHLVLKNNGSTYARLAFGSEGAYFTGAVTSGASFKAPIFYDSNDTSFYFDGSNTGDSIRCAGDIVAYYSDERLKDKKGNIENALEKVLSLNGFYYEPNEVAQELGYKKKLEVGVSAQEVEAVLPELIRDAPIGQGYKTLDYGKLTPLLIEAVKEQQKQIEELKELVNKLINK